MENGVEGRGRERTQRFRVSKGQGEIKLSRNWEGRDKGEREREW